MSDVDDLAAKLQVALAQQNTNPSFAGLQAPVDPSRLQNVLSQLKQQQYLQDTTGPGTGGPYGWLTAPTRRDFANLGQQVGNQLTGPSPTPQPTTSPQALAALSAQTNAAPSSSSSGVSSAYNGAIVKAKQTYAAMVQAGVDPAAAKVNTLKMLVAAGIPGADEALDTANAAGLKNQSTQAEAAKNSAQAGSYGANAQNQAFDQTTKQWKTTFTDPNGLYEIQTNGQGEQKRVELKPPPSASAQAAANLSPDSIQFAADTYRTTGQMPASFARSPAMQAVVLNKIAADAQASGDTAGAIKARTAALKANGTALDQVTKQESMTGSFVQTMESNLTALQKIGANLGSTDSPLFNKVLNHFNQGVVTDPTTASYVTMLNSVASEFAKIQSGSMGNTPVSDAARKEAQDTINKAMSQGGVAAVAATMQQEAGNRMQAIRDTKQGLISTLSGNAPGASQTPSSPPLSTPQPQTPPRSATVPTSAPGASTPPAGWTLKVDAQGRKAYVSPDGKNYQLVQ